MKKIIFGCLLMAFGLLANAQSTSVSSAEAGQSEEADAVYMVVDKMPEFPGGQQDLFNYLTDNVKYPAEAARRGLEGRTICQFVVEKDGSITDVKVVKSSGSSLLDKEALRVLRRMPNWIPGTMKGKPVRVKYTVPVNFFIN